MPSTAGATEPPAEAERHREHLPCGTTLALSIPYDHIIGPAGAAGRLSTRVGDAGTDPLGIIGHRPRRQHYSTAVTIRDP